MEINADAFLERIEKVFDAKELYGGTFVRISIRNVVNEMIEEFDQQMDQLYKEQRANGETFEDVSS